MGSWRTDIQKCLITSRPGVLADAVERLNQGVIEWAERASQELVRQGADEKTLVAYSETTDTGYMITMWGNPHYRSRFIVNLNCQQ